MNSERHRRVMQVLADVIDCDTSGRAAVLDEFCEGDPALRREVERLLEQQKAADSLMEEPLLETAVRHQPAADDSLIGKQVGPYRITDLIGRGGMGTVYLAVRNDDEYQRRVAIKLIKRGMDTDLILRRFRKERQILANLDHQYIARLFDGGTTEDGRPYLVMEHVEGLPVNAYADARGLSVNERLELFLKVCEAVQYAHRNQVVHRDLKPGNILVNEDGAPKLLDFGIAKLLQSESSGSTTEATTSAWRVMTPEYSSPEQIRGEHVEATSDVYSLGAVLYELLTGWRPYRMKGGGLDAIARLLSTEEPEKPSAAIGRAEIKSGRRETHPSGPASEPVHVMGGGAPERLRRELQGDLDNIVLMALRKEPQSRYQSVQQLAEDIRRHLQGHPVVASKSALAYRCAKFLKRNRVTLVTTLAVATLSLLLGLWLGLFSARPKVRESLAVVPLVNASLDPEAEHLSDGITEYLINYLSRIPHLTVPGRNSVFPYKGKAVEPAVLGRTLGVETLLTGRTTVSGENLSVKIELTDGKSGEVVWSKQYSGKSSEILRLQQEIADDITQRLGLPVSAESRERARRVGTQNPRAYDLYVKGIYFWNQRTSLGLNTAIVQFEQAIKEDPDYSLAYSGLANCYSLLGAYKIEPPKVIFPKAKAAALKAVELDESSAEAHTSLALVTWIGFWDWPGADREFRRAIELNPSYVTAHHWYGLYLGEMGRSDEAIASERRALELDPLSIYVRADMGRVYFYARRYDESLAQYHKAMELNPTFYSFYSELSFLLEQMELGEEWISVNKIRSSIGLQTEELVREKGMRGLWQRELGRAEKDGPIWGNYGTAMLYARMGRADRAVELLNKAYEEGDHQLAQIKVEPALDPIRSDPRFLQLMKRMHFEP